MDAQVFISHKHSDRDIALAVAQFIKEKTANKVGVHDSSSAEFEGPRVGKNLGAELKKALAQADVVILIYTTEDQDWQYCMWECGLATDPRDEHPTDVVVLQCGSSAPKPLSDTLRVDARSLESLTGFTKTLLTSKDLFPRLGRKISYFNPEDPTLKKYAVELHKSLAEVIPAGPAGQPSDVTSSTFLRIELPPDAVDRIKNADAETRLDATKNALRNHGSIVENERAMSLFGFKIDASTNVGKVLREWEDNSPGTQALWFESLAQQIALAIFEKYPDGVPWAPYSSELGQSTIPYVGRSRRTVAGGMQFDTYFIPVAPAPVKATARMIATSQIFHIRLDQTPPSQIGLSALINEMERGERTRVPILGEGSKALYIIHLSMIDKFFSKRARRGHPVDKLTLEDLLADESMANLFETSFVVIDPAATLAEAKAAIAETRACQDVFVTQDGTIDGAVIGWLTNTMLGE